MRHVSSKSWGGAQVKLCSSCVQGCVNLPSVHKSSTLGSEVVKFLLKSQEKHIEKPINIELWKLFWIQCWQSAPDIPKSESMQTRTSQSCNKLPQHSLIWWWSTWKQTGQCCPWSSPIGFITQYWVAKMLGMHSYLHCPQTSNDQFLHQGSPNQGHSFKLWMEVKDITSL